MDGAPDVTVIMANYNGAAFIGQAIGSVQAQSLKSWELIVVDDASRDDSRAVIRSYAQRDPRIRVMALTANGGPAAARNRALGAARGDWIAIFDSDDVMAPDRLERLLAKAHDEGASIVADNQMICASNLEPERPYLSKDSVMQRGRVDLAHFIDCGRLYSSHPDLGFLKPVIRRSLIASAGARYDESLRIGEDFHFLLTLLVQGAEIHIEPEPLYRYRKHGASISHRFSPAVLASMIAADQAFRNRLDRKSRPALKAINRRISGLKSWAAHEQAMAALKAGRVDEALGAALARPHAWRLMARPLAARASTALRSISARMNDVLQPPRGLRRTTMKHV
jgi:succinoglycan biosynthesis protein ExoO